MKKLFFFIPALLLSLLANAKEILIGSETSNIIHYTIAASSTSDGDVIILADAGPYFSTAGSDDYTKLVKNVTIKAADGIVPVVKLEVPFRMTEGKTVKFIGITFDGTSLTGYDFYFRFYDNSDNNLEFENCEFKNISKYIFDVYTGKKANSLKLTNCKLHDNSSRGILNRGTLTNLEINGGEIYNFTGYPFVDNYDGATLGDLRINDTEFYGNAKDIISGTATSHADSCIINNCYFHDNSRSAVYFAASTISGVETCDGVIVKNSTFANNDLSASSRSIIEVQNYGGTEAANIEVNVDHCTFYNNTTVNFDYSCIRSRKSTKVSITNSIFAYPSEIDFYATNCYGGTISNNLVYNLSRGHRSSSGAPAITNAIIADPLFTNAATSDFSLAGNWITMNLSPARGAATDGSDLGDPRWYTAETLPSTDFVSPGYFFDGTHAQLAGNIRLNASNYIEYYDKDPSGTATWKIHVTKACALQATLNMESSTSNHKFTIEALDYEGAVVGSVAEASGNKTLGDIELSGKIIIPTAGDYTIRLTNIPWTTVVIKGITLMNSGKAFTEIPGDLDPYDANTSATAYAAADGLHFAENPSSHNIATEWASWKVRAAEDGTFLFTMNVTSTNMQSYKITIYDSEDNVIDYYASNSLSSGDKSIAQYFYLEAGDYTVKVQPTYNWSHGYMKSLVVTEPADLLVIDENAANNDYLTAHLDETANIQITRTLLPGMYNTICLPFPVNSIAQLQNALGCEVELLKMSDAVIEEGGFVLTLTFTTDGSMYQGSPYLIKPAKKVVNPVFKDVTIKATTAGSRHYNETYCIGTLISSEVPAGANNLFLGSENKLYFSDAATPIKGMRAYFRIDETVPAPSRARIVAHEEVVTEVELVNGTLPDTFGEKAVKQINNGQLLIIRNGAYYNVMGQIVK